MLASCCAACLQTAAALPARAAADARSLPCSSMQSTAACLQHVVLTACCGCYLWPATLSVCSLLMLPAVACCLLVLHLLVLLLACSLPLPLACSCCCCCSLSCLQPAGDVAATCAAACLRLADAVACLCCRFACSPLLLLLAACCCSCMQPAASCLFAACCNFVAIVSYKPFSSTRRSYVTRASSWSWSDLQRQAC